MRRIALVLFIAAAVTAKKKNQPQVEVASVKLYNANGSHIVGAMNFFERNMTQHAFEVFGHLWDVPAGKYIGVVHERVSNQAGNFCDSLGPAVMQRDDYIRARRPVTLFLKKFNAEIGHHFLSVDPGATLKSGSRRNIMNHTVAIYRVRPSDLGLCFLTREKIAAPLACGVVVPGPVQPGDHRMPDLIEDEQEDDKDEEDRRKKKKSSTLELRERLSLDDSSSS